MNCKPRVRRGNFFFFPLLEIPNKSEFRFDGKNYEKVAQNLALTVGLEGDFTPDFLAVNSSNSYQWAAVLISSLPKF